MINFSKITERERHVVLTPEFQTLAITHGATQPLEFAQLLAADPERNPLNLCTMHGFECAGDLFFWEWGAQGHGIQQPVLFTARDGATLSGTVWATKGGPAKRPGIVITTGSVQAPEQIYWGLAAVLAKHGYVVLTYDVQGQGRSDLFGEAPDDQEGVPSQEGEPFFDGTEDALDFLLSGPEHPFQPRPSCTTGTSHAPKHNRRVAAGFNTAFNPLHQLVDSSRIGIAGHSLGASAISFVGQKDPRVDALVGWDNLSAPREGFASNQSCPSAPETRVAAPITKPALGMSADYSLVPTPYLAAPDPDSKNGGFVRYKEAGVDSMQVNIRGGTHYEFGLLPGGLFPYPFGTATLRGIDMTAWYTTAWFDRYVKGDAGAEARLLTDRWRADTRGAEVDPLGDGNLFSFYLRSRYDLRNGGSELTCDDLRAGCAGLAPDGEPSNYSYIADARRPDTSPSEPFNDSDGDGVLDPFDSCPTVQGPNSNGGCPMHEPGPGGGGSGGAGGGGAPLSEAAPGGSGAAKRAKRCKRKRTTTSRRRCVRKHRRSRANKRG